MATDKGDTQLLVTKIYVNSNNNNDPIATPKLKSLCSEFYPQIKTNIRRVFLRTRMETFSLQDFSNAVRHAHGSAAVFNVMFGVM